MMKIDDDFLIKYKKVYILVIYTHVVNVLFILYSIQSNVLDPLPP